MHVVRSDSNSSTTDVQYSQILCVLFINIQCETLFKKWNSEPRKKESKFLFVFFLPFAKEHQNAA